MKKILSLLLILPFHFSFSQGKEIESTSTIKSVTVFFTGAQINRKANVTLNPGTNLIRFSKLSPYIDPNSIQIEGSSKYTIVSVNHRHNYLDETQLSGEQLALKNKIDLLKNDLQINQAHIEKTNELISFYNANKSVIAADKHTTLDDIMDMSDLYQNKYKNILVEQLELKKKEKEINKKLALLQKQFSESKGNQIRNTTEIIVNISSSTKLTTDINFSYVVSQAQWTPSYDAKATDVSNSFALTYKAKVSQATGEDWKSVQLVLSTGNPSKNNNLPQLSTWEISGYDYEEAERKRKEAEKEYAKSENRKKGSYNRDNEVMAEDIPAPAPVTANGYEKITTAKTSGTSTYTTLTQSSVSSEFTIAIPYTIPSDNKDYSVEIRQINLDAKYNYYAAPKYDKSAFLIAYITGWHKLNLISGMANIYFQDSYVGQSWLETQSTADSLELSMGRDKSVVIERKKIKDYSKPTFIGSNKKVSIGIELIVKNTKNKAIRLELEDQFPVSKQKEIEVDLVESAGAVVTNTTGGLKWVMELKPGETKKIIFVYTVKYPKDKELDNF